jgi:hypothetical protein
MLFFGLTQSDQIKCLLLYSNLTFYFHITDGTSAIVEEPVIIDRVEHLRIMTIGINRPKKRNSVNEVITSRVIH